MGTKVREGVFETNSSSSHSVSIAAGDVIAMDETWRAMERPDGTLAIQCGEFGWEVEEYTDIPTKASYVLTRAITEVEVHSPWVKDQPKEDRAAQDRRDAEQTLAALRDSSHWAMIQAAFQNRLGKTVTLDDSVAVRYRFGYIDHQSCEGGESDCGMESLASQDALERFLFNSASILRTDNDNH